ncbi:hypothetical protein LV564_15210 [Komagataeibacter nataicola]|nr:hypothetical protein [Komagataeibacter nataicola]WEQ55410.1 hypothetical protein LV564_15210 [Komagataeibacter nataicola]WNM09719.1 hypothetical protein RI056_07435 [Komagataeibacter nataicola]
MHTLSLILATAAIVAGLATSNDLHPIARPAEICLLTCAPQ